jgi:uncharacterized membrane protein YfcA
VFAVGFTVEIPPVAVLGIFVVVMLLAAGALYVRYREDPRRTIISLIASVVAAGVGAIVLSVLDRR